MSPVHTGGKKGRVITSYTLRSTQSSFLDLRSAIWSPPPQSSPMKGARGTSREGRCVCFPHQGGEGLRGSGSWYRFKVFRFAQLRIFKLSKFRKLENSKVCKYDLWARRPRPYDELCTFAQCRGRVSLPSGMGGEKQILRRLRLLQNDRRYFVILPAPFHGER